MYEQIAPQAIMSKSLAIIDAGVDLSGFGDGEKEIVCRCVHASGDFGIAGSIRFSPGAVETGVRLIKERVPIFADVSMVAAGISPSLQKELSLEVHTRIHCPEVLKLSGQKGWTRAEAAVWLAREIINGGLAVIGNAPTA
ncbi:MAG: precorrin-8X methylmutase [Peptococcaceae bacterium]|nr:precorrin-8X methylmutase [Peptococcaceae bacterium]